MRMELRTCEEGLRSCVGFRASVELECRREEKDRRSAGKYICRGLSDFLMSSLVVPADILEDVS